MNLRQGQSLLQRAVAASSLERMYSAIRGVVRAPREWDLLVTDVVRAVGDVLPPAEDVLATIPPTARRGADESQVLHVEPDGTFSVVALVSRPAMPRVSTTTRRGVRSP